MAVMSVRIDDKKRKLLKVISSLEGKTMSAFIEDLIDDYIKKTRSKYTEQLKEAELDGIMRVSESAFREWNNEEDDVYDKL